MAKPTLEQLPNFFLLGAAKAGTTSLHAYLIQHPDIYAGTEKEPHFFDRDWLYNRGIAAYAETYFPEAANYPWRLDATVGYFHLPDVVIPRLKAAYGSAALRFIVSLREPVSRAWSHYLHRVGEGWEQLSFREALDAEESRAHDATEWDQYFSDGLYARQFRTWFSAFGRDQFFILLQEDLRDDAVGVMRDLFDFLEIDSDVAINTAGQHNRSPVNNSITMKVMRYQLPVPLGEILHPFIRVRPRDVVRNALNRLSRKRATIPDDIAAQLREAYRPDIIELSDMLDRDLSHWLDAPAT